MFKGICRHLAAVVLGAMVFAAHAADWPSAHPIKIIVPYPPGGSSDIVARSISQGVSEALKQTVIVENKAGANGNLGTDYVAHQPADGYVVLVCDVGSLSISPSVYTRLSFDPSRDLRGVTMLAYSPHMLVVNPSVPASNVKELVELSKKQPVNFAVTAIGSAPHLAAVELQRRAGAMWTYIPYKGGSQAISDTVSGQTQGLVNGMLATMPFVKSGQLKVLGLSKSTRTPLMPDVPTIAEQGFPGFETGTWQGVLVPKGVPDAIVQKLNQVLIGVVRDPDTRARLAAQGAEVVTMTPAEQDKFFEKERARWAGIVKEADIRLD